MSTPLYPSAGARSPGLTIFLGLPLVWLRPSERYVSLLHALAVGILFFLFFDITGHALEPVEHAFSAHDAGRWFLLALLIVGFLLSICGLTLYGHHARRRQDIVSPDRLALLISLGIGMHNFAEGLAIGDSALHGSVHLTYLLVIGFGLHNITEAFGIIAPLAGRRTSWRFLFLLGLIGGGPNMLGTIIGTLWNSTVLSVLFLSLSSGAIIYVIDALLSLDRSSHRTPLRNMGLAMGFLLGLLTDFILIAAGRVILILCEE